MKILANSKSTIKNICPLSTDKQSASDSVDFSVLKEKAAHLETKTLDRCNKTEIIKLFRERRILQPSKRMHKFTVKELIQFIDNASFTVPDMCAWWLKGKHINHFKKADLYYTLQNLAVKKDIKLDLKNMVNKIDVRWYIAAITTLDIDHPIMKYIKAVEDSEKTEKYLEELSTR